MTLYEKYQEWRKEALEEGHSEGLAAGLAEGLAAGLAEGHTQGMIKLICAKLKKNLSLAEIADHLETDEETVAKIMEIAKPFAPDYDPDQVFTAWQELKEAGKI